MKTYGSLIVFLMDHEGKLVTAELLECAMAWSWSMSAAQELQEEHNLEPWNFINALWASRKQYLSLA